MILIQSYSSRYPMESDIETFNEINSLIPNINLIYHKSEKPKQLRIRDFILDAIKVNFKSKKDEIIIGWGGDVCLYAWLFGSIFKLKRKYITHNLMVHERGIDLNWKTKFRYKLYKRALQSSNFGATVNSEELIDYYSRMFKCDVNKFSTVYDSVQPKDIRYYSTYCITEPYVFFGGKEERDVATFIKVVELLPNINFICVLPQKLKTSEMDSLNNLKTFFDIKQDEFYYLLYNASVCFIPLKSKTPCGLLVMQQAAVMGIPIVSTDTYSMRTVIPDDNFGFLLPIGDFIGSAEKVKLLIDNAELRNRIASNCKINARKFSPNIIGKQFCFSIDEIRKVLI